MPYLHWELDRRRQKLGILAKDLTERHRKMEDQDSIRNKQKLPDVLDISKQHQSKIRLSEMSGARYPTKSADHPRRPLIPTNACGRYLLQAARVFEAMELEPDMLLMRHHLHSHLPLHPRRTIDQSYYPGHEDTKTRDADQVVYRATKADGAINRNTRVIMVDQLWLYIIDDSNKSFCTYSLW
jgi:hypothetical protein